MSSLAPWLERASTTSVAVVTLAFIALLGGADYATGAELSSSVFYAIPVALAAWYGPVSLAFVACLAVSGTWYVADLAAGHTYSAAWIPVWNAGVRLLFFVIIAHLLVRLRGALETQRRLAERDGLTGLANARRFMAVVETEVARSARYQRPLSLAYVDLDGFKEVNDRLGHSVGDDVLEVVGVTLAAQVRAADLPARLGGDEFGVLFPETDAGQARDVAGKLRRVLERTMAEREWPVGFSIGVYTATGSVDDAEALIRLADSLMYEVKRSGKGRTLFRGEGSEG